MSDPVEVGTRVFQCVSIVVGLSTLILSARVLRLCRMVIRKLRAKAELETQISAREPCEEVGAAERSALLPPPARSSRDAPR